MIKYNPTLSFEKFEIMLRIYRISLLQLDKLEVYDIFKEIFKYDTFFTFIDEDTEMLKFNLNCKYVIEQICYELGIEING